MTDPAEYALKHDDKGWTVYNTRTGAPVHLNDAPQVGLTREVAREILQTLDLFKSAPDKNEPD